MTPTQRPIFFFFTRNVLTFGHGLRLARSAARIPSRHARAGKARRVEPGPIEMLERVTHIAGTEFPHEVENGAAFDRAMVKP